MRRNVHPPGNRGQSAGPGPGAPATAPNTPRKDGAALNRLIRSLEDEWRLGLDVHDRLLSPSQRGDTLAGKVYGQIQRLYYSSEPALDKALEGFRQIALGFEHGKRLELLHGTLKSQTRSPLSRTGTPSSSQARPGSVPPKTLKLSGHDPSRVSRSSGLFQAYRNDEPESYYATAPEPGSPTDEDADDDEYVTPPSPTLSSHSARRRVQASPHARFAIGSTGRKRLSNNSEDVGTSPKLTKTSKGKQPIDKPADAGPSKPFASSMSIPFKKPSLDMARSFQAASTKSSTNTSFNTMRSSQQTQPSTTMTSFTSDAYDNDVVYPKLTRTSSTTMGSLDDQDLADVSARLERETAKREMDHPHQARKLARESSSTFGSIDEGGLVEISSHMEARFTAPSISTSVSLATGFRPQVERKLQPLQSEGDMGMPSQIDQSFHGLGPRGSPGTSLRPPTTPSRSSESPFRTPNSGKSPSRLPYYIRNIPEQNLFVGQLPQELTGFPFYILFIGRRIASECGIEMRELMRGLNADDVRSDPATFWDTVKTNTGFGNIVPESARIWSAAKRNFDGYTFKGRVVFQKAGPVFDLHLLPLQAERSCRFQRKFGSHRFLYLNLPPFDTNAKTKPSRFTVDDMKQIEEQWKAWFQKEHSFLGRKWRAFHIEPIKKKKGPRRQKDDDSDRRMILFATEGVGIEDPMSVGEMLNWFIPFSGNMDQTFCKAYARMDLGLSRTIPTLAFKPSQIRRVDDITADGTPEDTQYNDPALLWNERPNPGEVMNDGCSRMSVGAALEIWRIYSKVTDSREPIPSVFQGRIGGAKGMWMACGEPSTSDPAELDIWIEITPSQLKFEFHEEDRFDHLFFDPQRLTFEHVDHSSRPSPSELHISFIPILVDRGVPQKLLADLITQRLDAEREELLQMLPNPVKLYHWLHKMSHSITDEDSPWKAAFPQSMPNKIAQLLESGFKPEREPYLADTLYRYIKQQQIWMERKLRVPLGKATFLFGIADPLGVLAPGEVHIDFSSPFVDEITGGTYRALNNFDVLIARQPACRRSDIQKVRAVKRPELSHLVDVVVFSSRGEYPAAGKLQGGDYDGDTFWLCWEPDLVVPFKNAPAPLTPLNPEDYGIQTDTRKLCEVMRPRELSTVDNFLKEALEFRMVPSLLGVVTNFLEKLAYMENQMYSERLDALCGLHDLLVDAPKSGYMFTRSDYDRLVRDELRCGNPKVPAYKQAMQDCEGATELGGAENVRKRDYKHKRNNVLDYLYFEVVRQHDAATLKSVKKAFPKDISDDPALQHPYIHLRNSGSDLVNAELDALVKRVKDLDQLWLKKIKSKQALDAELYSETVDACYKQFRDLMPTQVDHEDIRPLLFPYLQFDFSIWESVRASAAYTELPKRHSFVWHMAGRELAKLKCAPFPGAKLVIGSIYANLKPKPIKMPKPEEEDEESEEEFFESAVEYLYA
ncbi:hypothetical protein K458DRAFT_423437 [Lentithecium fluviatile CBS 122367]|uniref:RNA-dependent RNA polymerase n=1 Tax=Lentithecium fluviatile CBS 122367 TaxID=1168545 RepID=A0A6G1IJ59_9PLEO|nr:hypothetical protein K458DRAFT_423437 [Lentithecium fluviatile CBS 122367]